MIMYIMLNFIFFVLLNLGFIKDSLFFIENYFNNFSIALIYIVSFIYIHIAFSGLPFLSDAH